MVERGFVHASLNCEDVHPEIAPFADAIAHETRALPGSARSPRRASASAT